ncbi:hypothetical protein GJ496_005885 [Pomphorhynchus laevis]|nr:hypothetical protein GJ496_005885 [Pomphorhynchus laevis]
MCLEQSNKKNSIIIKKEYSMKDTFEMPDLSIESFANLTRKLEADIFSDLMEQFIKVYYKSDNPIVCDSACRKSLISMMRQYRPDL